MRRILKTTALLIMIFSSLTAAAAAAEEIRYVFKDSTGTAQNEVTVLISQDFITFTRNIDPDDPNLAVLGTDAKSLGDYLKENDIYVDAVSPDLRTEIFIIMNTTKDSAAVGNLSRISDKDFDELRNEIEQGMKERGFNILDYQVCMSGTQKYINMQYSAASADGNRLYGEFYSTVINGYQISFYLNNYASYTTATHSETLRHIVNSAEYYPKESYSSGTTSGFGGSLLEKVLIYGFIGGLLAAGRFVFAAIKKKKAVKEAATRVVPAYAFAPQNPASADEENPADILICPDCGARNQSGRRTCFKCGHPLKQETEQVQCRGCGAFNWNNRDNCASCGKPLRR